MSIQTIQLPPYGRLRIDGRQSVAYCNGDAPHLILVTGSDAVRLPLGQCLPGDANYLMLVNPFPATVVCAIGFGLPVQFGPEMLSISNSQSVVVSSVNFRVVLAGSLVAPQDKYAQAILMKRGRAMITVNDKMLGGASDPDRRVLILKGYSDSFLSAKPLGCLEDAVAIRRMNFEIDTSLFVFAGKYSTADFTAWHSAAGYTGEILSLSHQNGRKYLCTKNDMVIYAAYNNKGMDAVFDVEHLGDDVSEYD